MLPNEKSALTKSFCFSILHIMFKYHCCTLIRTKVIDYLKGTYLILYFFTKLQKSQKICFQIKNVHQQNRFIFRFYLLCSNIIALT